MIANFAVRQVLFDNGSSAEIIFFGAHDQLAITEFPLVYSEGDLFRFAREHVRPVGSILLLITMGTYLTSGTTLVDFLVANKRSTYNAIIGCSTLVAPHAITSIYRLTLKFPTPMVLGVVKRDQRVARGCYYSGLKGESCQVVEQRQKTIEGGMPLVGTDLVENLDTVEVAPGKIVNINAALTGTLRDSLVKLLTQHFTTFAWSHSDMEGIDLGVIAHHLSVLPDAKPFRQKRRTFTPECNQAVTEEVGKLLAADFIREVQYPD